MKVKVGPAIASLAAVAIGLSFTLLSVRGPAGGSTSGLWTVSPAKRTVDVTCRFTVREIPTGAREIAAWVPIPPTNAHQKLEDMWVGGGWPYTIVSEPEYGNRYLCFDLSGAFGGASHARDKDSAALPSGRAGDQAPADSISVTVIFRVERRAYRALESPASGEGSPSPVRQARFLAPDRLVPIDGKIAEEAARVAGGAPDAPSRARRLYEHIVETVRYDKSGQGWGRGDAIYACDVRAGNCTDFHSLFIGEARSLRIAARFVMGLPIPEGVSDGAVPGYHCWAEFAADGYGWVPIDASEAWKHPERRAALFGGLDANRVQFTIGRDIHLPGANGEPLNYSIAAYAEMNGKAYSSVETVFSFRDVRQEGSPPPPAGG